MVTIVIDIFLFKRHFVLATQDLHEVPRKRKLNNHDQWRTRILELLYGVGYRPGTSRVRRSSSLSFFFFHAAVGSLQWLGIGRTAVE